MVKVKICGLRTLADVKLVNQVQPDYVGLVFAPSRRQLDLATAQKLVRDLEPRIATVGVFANSKRSEIEEIINSCNLDILQLHGSESPADCLGYHIDVWKAFPIKTAHSLVGVASYAVAGVLLDTFHPHQLGGTGEAFNWDLVTEISKKRFTILAGGLTPHNVVAAIKQVQPQVVDVSSGVELNGNKDYQVVNEFVTRVRSVT